MSEIGKAIDRVVGLRLGPMLKAAGFSKSARTFHRHATGVTHVVNVQGSQGNIGDSGEFTINLGVFVREFYPVLSKAPPQRSRRNLNARCAAGLGR
jgi:hypothetical protein